MSLTVCFKCGTFIEGDSGHPCGDSRHKLYTYKYSSVDTDDLIKVEQVDYNPRTHFKDGSIKYPNEESADNPDRTHGYSDEEKQRAGIQ